MTEMHPDNYQSQLDEKATRQRETFKKFSPPELEVFASPPENWHRGRRLDVSDNDDPGAQDPRVCEVWCLSLGGRPCELGQATIPHVFPSRNRA